MTFQSFPVWCSSGPPSVLQFWSLCPASPISSHGDCSLMAACSNLQFSAPRSHSARFLLIFLGPSNQNLLLLLFRIPVLHHVPFNSNDYSLNTCHFCSWRICVNLNEKTFLNFQIPTNLDQLPADSRYSRNTEELMTRMSWHRLIPHCPWLIGNWHSFNETQRIASMTKWHVLSSS